MTTPDAELERTISISSVVRHAIVMIAPSHPAFTVEGDHLINDLAFDSLTLVELAFALEELFGLDAVTPERAMTLRTVGDIITHVEAALASGVGEEPSVEAVQAVSAQYGRTWNPDS
jgi:acyl carrier protein